MKFVILASLVLSAVSFQASAKNYKINELRSGKVRLAMTDTVGGKRLMLQKKKLAVGGANPTNILVYVGCSNGTTWIDNSVSESVCGSPVYIEQ